MLSIIRTKVKSKGESILQNMIYMEQKWELEKNQDQTTGQCHVQRSQPAALARPFLSHQKEGPSMLAINFYFLITERAYRIARLHFNNKNSLKNISIQFQIIDK